MLAAAKEIGVQVTNVGAEDIMEGRVRHHPGFYPNSLLDLAAPRSRHHLAGAARRTRDADAPQHRGPWSFRFQGALIYVLLRQLTSLQNLRSAQEILLKWVNDSIAAQGCKRTARNLSSDISVRNQLIDFPL